MRLSGSLIWLLLLAGACASPSATPDGPGMDPSPVESVSPPSPPAASTAPPTRARPTLAPLMTPSPTEEVVGIDVQGHRGARGLRPESTLPSFEAALDAGATTLELDLHVSADDVLVVWHDPVILAEKCAPGSGPVDPDAGIRIRSLAASALRQLDCRRNPDEQRFPDQLPDPGELAGDDYGIVSLEELFGFVAEYSESASKTDDQRARAGAVGYNIELKGSQEVPRLAELLAEAVGGSGIAARVIVQSFSLASLRDYAELDPATRRAFVTSGGVPDLTVLQDEGIEVWSPAHRDLAAPSIMAATELGIAVIPYTVNDPERMRELIDQGVDGLITDRPDLAAAVVAE